MNPDAKVTDVCKVVLLGQAGVGKTCLSHRFVKGQWNERIQPTIGAAFLVTRVPIGNGRVVKLEIWDTAGAERFATLAPLYYRDANAAVIVYDVFDRHSFQSVDRWLQELKEKTTGSVRVYVAGNKVDIPEEKEISEEEAAEYAKDHGANLFLTSAKEDINVSNLFNTIASETPASDGRNADGFDIHDDAPVPENPGSCCT